jgi:hypothetical protein
MNSLYDCVICGKLECEHVDSWNMYGGEYVMLECKCADLWPFMWLGCTTGIKSLIGHGHSTGGIGRWLPSLLP